VMPLTRARTMRSRRGRWPRSTSMGQ
jgi:hypothetical protein